MKKRLEEFGNKRFPLWIMRRGLQKAKGLWSFALGRYRKRTDEIQSLKEGRHENQSRAWPGLAWGIFATTAWTHSTSDVFDMYWYFDI